MAANSPDDFDQVLAALGLMTSRFNWLETEFKLALIKLLNCRNLNAAYAMAEERRRFEHLVALVKKLFEIYNLDAESRTQLSAIISEAKSLSDQRNIFVHSIWYKPVDPQKSVARMKGRSSQEMLAAEIIEIANRMQQCHSALKELMTYSLPIDTREQ